MKLKDKLNFLLNKIEDTIFEEHLCICCGLEIPDGNKFQICDDCFSKINVIDGNVCKKCGNKLSDTNLSIRVCDDCKDKNFNFEQNHSFCYYDEVASNIVKKFKYSGHRYLAKHIAEMMFENKSYFENIDFITFVPISKSRKRERGFNQAEEIAKELSKLSHIETKAVLLKSKDSRHQAGLSQEDRMNNLKDSFAVIKAVEPEIKGKNILIIDDVFTTGTTLDECSKVLKKFKPNKIYTYTFAKTDFHSLNY